MLKLTPLKAGYPCSALPGPLPSPRVVSSADKLSGLSPGAPWILLSIARLDGRKCALRLVALRRIHVCVIHVCVLFGAVLRDTGLSDQPREHAPSPVAPPPQARRCPFLEGWFCAHVLVCSGASRVAHDSRVGNVTTSCTHPLKEVLHTHFWMLTKSCWTLTTLLLFKRPTIHVISLSLSLSHTHSLSRARSLSLALLLYGQRGPP